MSERQKTKHISMIIRGIVGRSGGAERVYCELANILVDAGYRVTCLYYDPKSGVPFYPLDPRVERINLHGSAGAKAYRNRSWIRPFSKRARDEADWNRLNGLFVRQLREYFQLVGPDIAISVMPPANTPVLMAASGTSVKVIACNHNVPDQDYDNPKRWSPNPVDRQLRLSLLDNAAAIHVLFPEFGAWFPSHLSDRIVAIPNHISPDIVWPVPRPVREKVVLGVGRLTDVKNYMQLVSSWALLADSFPDWKVKIFGVGPQLEMLTQEIGRLGLDGRIELPGSLSDLSAEYAKASIFCHPALFEGFGLSVAEALHLELPVVCYSDCSGVREFVRDGYNGLTAERNGERDELADALRRLMVDEDLRLSLGARGPDSVGSFTVKDYRARWIELIEKTGRAA